YKIWLYPSQVEAWHMVGWGKLGSWYLLLLLILDTGSCTITRSIADYHCTWDFRSVLSFMFFIQYYLFFNC
ncbi:DUF817 family protein, partial [Acinetobacter baumannii]|nr:DUF817 family protein [Acinetobacter baumannii]